jgi:hypothetical protein
MSRALNLALSEDQVLKHCTTHKVGVSALERLPGGGVRLVCCSGDSAEQLRKLLKKHLMDGDVTRTVHRPSTPLW